MEMNLEDYRKQVENALKAEDPYLPKDELNLYLERDEELWRMYMRDFSPEVCAQAMLTGLI